MTGTELYLDDDGYVSCPRRGDISAEWCEGCPFLTRIERSGGRVVVVCDPGPRAADLTWSSGMRDVPDLWR